MGHNPSSIAASKPGGRARFLVNTLLLLVSVCVPLAAVELYLRWTQPPPNSKNLFVPVSDPEAYTLGQPNTQGIYAGTSIHFNRLGLRDKEFSDLPDPDTFRIIMLGDSITFGQGVPQDSTYPVVTETLINKLSPSDQKPVEILNFGIPGYNTIHQLKQFRDIGLARKPDLVVVGFLYNDVLLPKPAGTQQQQTESILGPINRLYRSIKKRSLLVTRFAPAVGEIVRRFGGQGLGQIGSFKHRYVDGDPDWERVQQSLLELNALGVEHDFDLAIAIIPAMANCVEGSYPLLEYHEAVSNFAQAHKIPYLDLLDTFWGIDAHQFWVSPTDGHPNTEGHALIAGSLSQFLSKEMLPN